MPRRRKPSGSSSSRRRRRDEEDEVSSDDSTSDSDFVADSDDQDKEEDDDEEEEGFAADDDDAPAPVRAVVRAVAPPLPPPAAVQVLYQPRKKGKGRKSKRARDERGPLLPWEEWEEANERWFCERAAAAGVDGDDLEPEAAVAGTVPTADPAPEVLLPLLRFQKEWLAWALAQEGSASRGGILADEMGMGKTIQAISLVLTARQLRPPGKQASSSSSTGRPMRRVGCTLVVCPVVAVIQWAQEIERHTAKGTVRVLLYHGPRRADQKIDFNSYDFVITTYSTIEADYRKNIMPSKIRCEYCDKLFYPNKMKVHLKYYCGPEAVRTEKQAKQQSKKWKSSKVKGKKGHKKEEDEEKEDFEALGNELCSQPRGQSPLHLVRWERVILDEYISKPIQWGSASDEGKQAMILLKEKVLKGIVLRRTIGRAADLAMPPKIVTLRRDSFDKNEMEFYEALYTQSCTQFDSYVAAGTLMNNYAHIFDLLTRLRQAVDHPYLVAYSKTAGLREGLTNGAIERECGICHNMAEDIVVTSCDHAFCKTCLMDYSATLGNVLCPSCSQPLTVDLTTTNSGERVTPNVKGRKRSGILSRLASLADFKTSTKIDALREEVRNMIEHDGSAKGIVFSQFTSFLDLIQFSLEKSGIKCVQLNGAMNITEKGRAIDTFTNDSDCRIFLMSLKAGGVALNLTVASHVFLMDPWWNPAVESQAQDRIHRIGQFKPIRSMRFVIKDTVEERILQLQEKKQLVFEGTVGDSPEAMSKLTEADLRFLFQI
ncbi:hypothetical protein PR202_gb20943 [Eleusine coracana subsp. coracana]|uniref:Uncharacterized protein n=1 Tax=Eleusine coracana subsp. coracana TaxID=191504 RepID=A0AAV5FC82_ELECO|nr:hypothetical protein PR202_gb20943 [Eleusine coracana subsp. coracana]